MIMNCFPLISAIVIMLISSRSQPKPAANNSDDGLARSQAEVFAERSLTLVLRTPKDGTLWRLRRMRKSNLR
jgi:hypothetical protein